MIVTQLQSTRHAWRLSSSCTFGQSGAVSLTAKATLNEPMTEALATWVHDDVAAAAREILKTELTSLRVVASYDCRTRDHVPGAKLSEHAFGNAIDIAGFRAGDHWIEVGGKDNSADEVRFLDAVRAAACKRFMTVLGPGSDSDHATHFHLDLAHRGKTGTYRLCE
jgi:hypothetical protein